LKKVPTIFIRNPKDPSRVTEQINPVCQWVFDGEGIPTRKLDGTAVLIQSGKIFKRYDNKEVRTPPDGFIEADEPDPVTKHHPGWVPVDGKNGDDHWYLEAAQNFVDDRPWLRQGPIGHQIGVIPDSAPVKIPDGTYELLHPKFQGRDSHKQNPEEVTKPVLVKHGSMSLPRAEREVPRDLYGLVAFFRTHSDIEGIVWHHPDGRMAKIKLKDVLGVKRREVEKEINGIWPQLDGSVKVSRNFGLTWESFEGVIHGTEGAKEETNQAD
jgi:hypothetical protein